MCFKCIFDVHQKSSKSGSDTRSNLIDGKCGKSNDCNYLPEKKIKKNRPCINVSTVFFPIYRFDLVIKLLKIHSIMDLIKSGWNSLLLLLNL